MFFYLSQVLHADDSTTFSVSITSLLCHFSFYLAWIHCSALLLYFHTLNSFVPPPPSNSLRKKKTQFWLNLTIIRSLTELKQQYSFVENNTTAFSTYFKIMTTLSDGNSIQPLLFICPNKYTLLLSVMMISELFCFLKPPLFPSLLTPNCEYLITVHKTK